MKERNIDVAQSEISLKLPEQVVYMNPQIIKAGEIEDRAVKKEETKEMKYVPAEIKRAGELLHKVRITYGVSASDIARGIYVKGKIATSGYIHTFEKGENSEADLDKIIRSVEKHVNPSDLRLLEMNEIYQKKIEEAKWLWRLEEDGVFIGDAIKLIRLSRGETITQFAYRFSFGVSNLQTTESGKKPPRDFIINEILTKTGFDERQEKVAQRIRLLGCQRDPVSMESFEEESFGENIKYLRTQKGLTQKALGLAAGGKTTPWVGNIEQEKYKKIPEPSLKALLKGLGIPNELQKFMELKIKGEKPNLSDDQRAALAEKYYFLDLKKENEPSPFTRVDERLSKKVMKAESFGAGFRTIRMELGLSQFSFGKEQRHISKIELGTHVPEDYYIADLIRVCELSILDRTSKVLFDLAKKSKRRGSNKYPQ